MYSLPQLDFNFYDSQSESTSPTLTSYTNTSLFGSSPQSPLFLSEPTVDFDWVEDRKFFPSPSVGYNTPMTHPLELFPSSNMGTPTPDLSDHESESPASPKERSLPGHRKGPGRPSKAEMATRTTAKNRRSMVDRSRQLHNDSASRSRARFSSVLEDLWNEIPLSERARSDQLEVFGQRQLSRAEKVEMAVLYVRKLQQQL